jgi:hypothetical protein
MTPCVSKRHWWLDPEDALRCCNPQYCRVQGLRREELEVIGAEHIVYRHLWRGWLKKTKQEDVQP